MLRQRAYVKVTGKGSITKVVKEHYLRDDIPCGVRGCAECQALLAVLPSETVLMDPSQQAEGRNRLLKAPPTGHILLPDTNILLHHLDVVETAPFCDLAILQTVLDEVKSNNAAIYRRLRSLLTQPAKRMYVFSNEHRRETFLERQEGESDNDRNDRSIRKAAAWYQEHVQGLAQVVLLTNDQDNRRRAAASGLMAVSLREYVGGIVSGAEPLLDMLESARDSRDEHTSYDEHQSPEQIRAGIEAGRLVQGVLQVSPYNRQTATVTASLRGSVPAPILVGGLTAMNRALQGDLVAVELLPRDQWRRPGEAGAEAEADADADASERDKDLLAFPAVESVPEGDAAAALQPHGKVVGIVRRAQRTFCGCLDRKSIREDAAVQNVLVVLLDRRMPRIRIRTRNARELATKRILVSVDGWERSSRYPHGHLVRVLGTAGDRATETEVILLEHDVAYTDFTPQVLACLPTADWRPSPEDLAERADFRDLDVCSVDPPGCTDIDDALHARELPNGNIEVGVHIADVTHFVRANTPLDAEAAARATTVYLVDRRIDMLPGLLGTSKPEEARLAASS